MANSKSRIARGRLFTSTLLAGAAALGVPAAVGLLASIAPSAAMAQDYTSGTLAGTVSDNSGAPVPGARVTVRSQQTGVSQTSTTNAQGGFRAPLIPTGSYTVTISKDGYSPTTQSDLAVRIGGASNYGFTLSAAGGDVSEVVVVAKKAQPQLDFSQATKGISIDVEQLQKQVPIARNVTAVVLLAPGTFNASSTGPAFTNTDGSSVPGIGGSSAGENAFFINGLNITNFDTYIGAGVVPFDFYKTIEVKTGGYPAEFGRATGGVINAVTKSGTNDFYFAVHGDYTPDIVRENAPNTYGSINAAHKEDSAQTSFEFGGPIIRDHLFFYGLYQLNHDIQQNVSGTSQVSSVDGLPPTNGTLTKTRNDSPFYGFKIDGYLTSRQHVEFTDFSTAQTETSRIFNYALPFGNATTDRNGSDVSYINGGGATGTPGAELVGAKYKSGGANWVAKYTGTFTDWFTISGAYGHNNDESYGVPALTGNAAYVTDARATGVGTRISQVTQAGALQDVDTTHREFYRVDADLYVDFLGKHHFRAGYDNEDTTLKHLETYNGGGTFNYSRVRTATQSTNYDLPLNQEYVRVLTYNLGASGAPVYGNNAAYYFQDSWDVLKGLNLQLGVRNDSFSVKNLSGETSVDLPDNWAPRLALSYDPFGHGTDKFSVSYGRYYQPPASNASFRGRDLYAYSYYLPPGGGLSYSPYIDPATGVPTGLGALITNGSFNQAAGATSPCPAGTPAAGSNTGCIVYGNGTQEPAASKTALDLEATAEDEFIVGYEKKLGPLWSVFANVTYRKLLTTSEDVAIDSAVLKYCARNPNINGCSDPNLGDVFSGDSDYVILNPGRDTTVRVRTDLDTPLAGQAIKLTAADLANPEAKREYYALELGFNRAFDGKWSLAGNYTLSKLQGNYEGTVKSEVGTTGQTDAGTTQDFDHPGLEEYAFGLLPNHHAHQIKLYGSYQVFSSLLVGASLQVQSPQHYGCIGVYPVDGNDPYGNEYGVASHYCGSSVETGAVAQPAPEGEAFVGDWFYQLDVSMRYSVPKFTKYVPGNIVLRLDVFNIFNSQQVVKYNQDGDEATNDLNPYYKLPLSYQTPRFVRFGFDCTF